MMARGDSLMCSRNPGSNYKSGLIAPKRITTSVTTKLQHNNKSFMRCRSGKARWRTTMKMSLAGERPLTCSRATMRALASQEAKRNLSQTTRFVVCKPHIV